MSELKVVTLYGLDALNNDIERQYYHKSEVDKVIAELKARDDVLVTDNRDLLDKVKMLEERLLENAGHFKRNEAQILENADKVIAKKDKEIAKLKEQVALLQAEFVPQP